MNRIAGDSTVGRDYAIELQAVGKTYRIYDRPSHRLIEVLGFGSRHKEFVALEDIDLAIAKGETVGIVGRNGSGKSTLLQLIAGSLTPTKGSVMVKGRVAALLELGTGFNPEFSGRENVFLNGQVLGLRRQQVEERMDRIEAFADIGDFIEQPVRTYSSGMLVRLAFSVAINTDPDILIIDEALAVGDEAFQRKCFAKLEDIRARGATILFVSHAAESVIKLCDRAVLLDAGQRLMTGKPKGVIGRFQKLLYATPELRDDLIEQARAADDNEPPVNVMPQVQAVALEHEEPRAAAQGLERAEVGPWPDDAEDRWDEGLQPESTLEFASNGALISDLRVISESGSRVNVLIPGRGYTVCYRVEFTKPAREVEFGMVIKTVDGVTLFGLSSHGRKGFVPEVEEGSVFELSFRFETKLLPGTYFFNVGCQGWAEGMTQRSYLHRVLDAGCFRIEARPSDRYMIGFYDLSQEPSVEWRRFMVHDDRNPALPD